VHVPVRGTRSPGAASGACRSGTCFPWPLPLAPHPPPPVARPRSRGSPLLWQGPTSRCRASSATAFRLPDADQTASACGRPRDLPVPAQGACTHARVSDRAGSSGGSRWRLPPCCLPLSRRRRHPGADFRGSMAGLCVPLSTLRRALAGRRRMTRGQCGSLLLHCSGLSPLTPCRSPGAPRRAQGAPQHEGGCYGVENEPHPEEAVQRPSRRTHPADPAGFQFLHTLTSGSPGLTG